ncbi:uncharacterized protein BDZ99DRAFT_225630 [Mytilinidion resinicola]|uniref:Uncharacterized protein n=1 Tax=Mytilinidion resinicola TaxID=574789 RepID=A0A6A6YZE6_9PEZI|nr:uncharacterized protein BDZ99DRAFT_225630 [Mytilinidion resinicola]KAF2813823.1 hypothetical protein BDZ99DRAFT_225630 [Mytilinidion resinicola]
MFFTLHRGRNFDACLPADHIYGMLGLPALESLSQAVVLDYTKDSQTLFQQVVRISVKQQGNLDALSFAQHSGGVPFHRPTWVAQWDEKICLNLLFGFSIFTRRRSNADRSSAVQTKFSGDYMLSTGVCLDSIESRLKIDSSYWFDESSLADVDDHPLLTFIRTNAKNGNKYLRSSAVLAYGRTLAGGVDGDFFGDNQAGDDSPGIVGFCQYVVELMKGAGESPDSYSDFELDMEGVWQTYAFYASTKMWNRCIFTTRKGYVGSRRDLLQSSDKICVLFGGRVPYILRPQQHYYQLIGEAYLDGFMEGKAMDMLDRGELAEEVFEIH